MRVRGLQESPEKEEIFRAAGNPILVVDHEGRILDVNGAAVAASGISAAKMKAKKCWHFLHSPGSHPEDSGLQEMLFSGRFETVEALFGNADVVSLVSCTPVRDESGQVQRFVLIMTDVTAAKQREEALRKELEESGRSVHENRVISEIGRIISSSVRIEEVFERFSEEVRKLIPFDRIVINTIDEEKDNVINVYMTGKGISDRRVGEVYPLHGSGNAEMVRNRSVFLLQTEDFYDMRERFPMLRSTFEAGFRSIMNVPLFLRGRIVGGLLLRSLEPRAYTQEHGVLAARISNQIAGTVANIRLYLELEQTHEEREKLIRNLQEALVKVKTLSGLLPICSACKKIRDDKGYWRQIESYIRDHSEAEFSHGICPDCMRKLYPDFDLYEEGKDPEPPSIEPTG
jgi:PAS domain S-box-containing protein